MSSQFGLGFFFVGLHDFVLVCMFVCSFVFEGRRELRVEGEWGTPEETGTRLGTELQCIVVAVGLEDGGDVLLKRINS